MGLTVEIPEAIANAVEELSKASGIPAEELVMKALSAHFPPITPELQEEFDAWERASDEDGARFYRDGDAST